VRSCLIRRASGSALLRSGFDASSRKIASFQPAALARGTMNIDEFRVRGKEMIEYICEYIRTLEGKRVTANVDPGYLRSLLPKEAPITPDPWEAIIRDIDGKIMPGVSCLPASNRLAAIIDPPSLSLSLSLFLFRSPSISTSIPPPCSLPI